MPSSLNAILSAWLAAEPMAGSTMLVAAFLFFVAGLARILSAPMPSGQRAWRMLALLGRVFAFFALVWGSYFLLHSSNASFGNLLSRLMSGGDVGRKQQVALATNWGGGIDQSDLRVLQSTQKEALQEFPQPDNKPSLWLKRSVIVPLDQESLVGFQGRIDLFLVDQALATYNCNAAYGYAVLNGSDFDAITEFSFPVSPHRFYANIAVKLDGRPVAWTIENDAIHWVSTMLPQQRSQVEIAFQTRGVGHFAYAVSSPRVIQDYSLTVFVDSTAVQPFVSPDSSAIVFTRHTPENGKGSVMQWTIDHAVMAPRISVQFVQPPKTSLSWDVLRIIDYASRGLVLMLSLITLTLIICNLEVGLGRLVLVVGLLCAQFLALLAVYPLWANTIWPLLLFSLPTLLLAYLVFRGLGRLPLVLILVFVAIFVAAYPFVGLVPGERERNAIDGALQAGMILYIFGLTFYTRLRPLRK